MDLPTRSVEIILRNQSTSGAYVASPAFPSYAYCWLRDGSFIAHAMDLVGEYESSRTFHIWAGNVIERYQWKIEQLIEKRRNGEPLKETDFLHTRYTLDGMEASTDWWNFQLDGYGTWLWALAEHARLSGEQEVLDKLASSISTVTRYLLEVWRLPNYDCWEEYPEYRHSYTLASIFGGLQTMAQAQNTESEIAEQLAEIRHFVLEHGVMEGRLTKSILATEKPNRLDCVDANLLGVAIPYSLLEPDDPVMEKTVVEIERSLHSSGGGVYRYANDTYYGGGEWILLTAWLGWYYATLGKKSEAHQLLEWIEEQCDARGNLPEQVSGSLLAPNRFWEWERRWGPVASPLLWSHAMYLILYQALNGSLAEG